MDNSNLTVGEIDRGYLVEQINEYLAKIVVDIADPNKEPTKKRTVDVKITFSPSKSRREAEVSYLVTLKPSTHVERKSTIYMGKAEDGSPIAKPYVPNQAILPGVEDALSTNESSN
jgi:hypothetical protein